MLMATAGVEMDKKKKMLTLTERKTEIKNVFLVSKKEIKEGRQTNNDRGLAKQK